MLRIGALLLVEGTTKKINLSGNEEGITFQVIKSRKGRRLIKYDIDFDEVFQVKAHKGLAKNLAIAKPHASLLTASMKIKII